MKLINSFESSGIGWIPQNPKLAEGSIRKQFQLVKPEITDEQIQQLLNSVNLNLNELPYGLDSKLESGSELMSAASGGQIRKIAIARALARKPKFLIADEPTADLDENSGRAVIKLLRTYASEPERGVIIITHDESQISINDEMMRFDR
jgi:ABC-type transport system involved in cytochrome bd biosynthesis fused ATPase/permease subunit